MIDPLSPDIVLTTREWGNLTELLENPPAPGERLTRIMRPSDGGPYYRLLGFLVDPVEMGLTAAGPVLKRRPRKVPRSAWFRLKRSDRRKNMIRWWL